MTTTTTETMTGRTESMTLGSNPQRPSATALAARSLLAIDRMPVGSPERAEALRQHGHEFARPARSSCPVR